METVNVRAFPPASAGEKDAGRGRGPVGHAVGVEKVPRHRAVEGEVDVLGNIAGRTGPPKGVGFRHHHADDVPRQVDEGPAAVARLNGHGDGHELAAGAASHGGADNAGRNAEFRLPFFPRRAGDDNGFARGHFSAVAECRHRQGLLPNLDDRQMIDRVADQEFRRRRGDA